jgi:hypothetical protein
MDNNRLGGRYAVACNDLQFILFWLKIRVSAVQSRPWAPFSAKHLIFNNSGIPVRHIARDKFCRTANFVWKFNASVIQSLGTTARSFYAPSRNDSTSRARIKMNRFAQYSRAQCGQDQTALQNQFPLLTGVIDFDVCAKFTRQQGDVLKNAACPRASGQSWGSACGHVVGSSQPNFI